MIQYLSLFSGIGAFEKALENIGVPFSLIAYCEIDKFAARAYSLIHNVPEELNLGDITKVDEFTLPTNIDLLTYGFPCQDISVAGRKKGLTDNEGNKTRSGLFFDALRIIEHCKPKIAIAENVKNLTMPNMKDVFNTVLSGLEEAGYNNYYQVLNAADFGIPQKRERVFIVSYRKDIDNHSFKFPRPTGLDKCMGDLLDNGVPESFFLSDEKIKSVIKHNSEHPGHIGEWGGYCPTILARDCKDPKVVRYP